MELILKRKVGNKEDVVKKIKIIKGGKLVDSLGNIEEKYSIDIRKNVLYVWDNINKTVWEYTIGEWYSKPFLPKIYHKYEIID
jgi:hypothetical protein